MKVKLDEEAYLPERAHDTDAGLDLRSREDRWLHPGEHTVIDTGVHVEIPLGHVGLITSKSGLMARGITCRGTIDAGYTGSLRAVLYNHGPDGWAIHKGDKVCQLVVMPIKIESLEVVDDLGATERGDAGFGSTGA